MKPPRALSDAELYAELAALSPQASPLSLACSLDPTYQVRQHLTIISDEFVSMAAGDVDRLLIVCPPQVGKSVTAAVWGPLWWLATNPAHRVIVASYANSLALRRGKLVRRLVESHGEKLGISLEYGSAAANDWELTSGGGMRSVGVGAGLTGHSGDLLVVDDPHKDRAEADSVRIRDSVHEWWSSVALSRLSPGAPVVLILTRWHPDDLAGRIIGEEGTTDDGGRWRVVHMPAVCDNPAKDALGRRMGDPLPHPKIAQADTTRAAEHWADKRKTSVLRDWFALYQGNPQPAEGALVTAELLRERRDYRTTEEPMKTAVAVDPSGGGRDVAGIIGGYLGATDRRLYITHDRSLVGTADQWSRAACELAAEIDADRIIVENNYGADMARLVVRTAWDTLQRENPDDPRYQRHAPRIEMVNAKKSKLLRAEPIAQQITEDHIRLAAYLPELEHEWQTWQPTDPSSPGRIDASVYLAYGLLPVPGAGVVISTSAGVSRSAVRARGMAAVRKPAGVSGRASR